MTNLDVFTVQQTELWQRSIEQCAPYDFYHLPQYHQLAEQEGGGSGRLFVYSQEGYTIALPLLIRNLDQGWLDATSVYGYAGPICSHPKLPDGIIHNFQSALEDQLREMRVVSVFSRLHPFFPQRALLAGLGDSEVISQTVSIDLTLPAEVQRARFRRSHRESSNRMRRRGVTCVVDQEGVYFDDFRRVYEETMRRVDAADHYYFSPAYFECLRQALGTRLSLFVCQFEGKVVCAALFVTCHGIIQYHLGGTADAALALAPMKLLMDEVRQWATDQELQVFHLGGGLTSNPEDPLLFFKKGFSDRTHDFATWQWVVVPEIYQRFCMEKARWNEQHHCQVVNPRFFPAYRSPTRSAVFSVPVTAPAEIPIVAIS